MDTSTYMRRHQQHFETRLKKLLLQAPVADARLSAAMEYSLLAGGKRLRPLLAYAAAEALGADASCADMAACALEMMHTYSLIHDDLPAMDDDPLRRGKPTCHIRFDEATAILAGDALQAMAFDLLASSRNLAVGDRTRLEMIRVLSRAGGATGMVAGQSMDIRAAGKVLSQTELEQMHSLKTGALIRASVVLGALSTNIASPSQISMLDRFAGLVGLAFQIRDDILDVSSDTHTLGKQQGRDLVLDKPTSVSLLGLEGASDQCQQVLEQALDLLQPLGDRGQNLAALTRYIGQRSN